MTAVIFVMLGFVTAVALMIVRALLVDEAKGRLKQHVTNSVEATIASLPKELEDEWAQEWRAELSEVITMPLSAVQLARGLRKSANQLIAAAGLVPATAPSRSRRLARWVAGRHGRSKAGPETTPGRTRRLAIDIARMATRKPRLLSMSPGNSTSINSRIVDPRTFHLKANVAGIYALWAPGLKIRNRWASGRGKFND